MAPADRGRGRFANRPYGMYVVHGVQHEYSTGQTEVTPPPYLNMRTEPPVGAVREPPTTSRGPTTKAQ